MNIIELVNVILSDNDLAARQIVKNSIRENFDWSTVKFPGEIGNISLALAASLVEMFAVRKEQEIPNWVYPSPTRTLRPEGRR
jgi:hypothetical protein